MEVTKRDILREATEAQRLGSDPGWSAWVSASAGSGKTKVLGDRVLRLLLGNVPPAKILCLTFTKAAAAGMSNRVAERLGHVGHQSGGLPIGCTTDPDHDFGQFPRLLHRRKESTTPDLHVEHDHLGAGCQFFAHDAARKEWDTFDRSRHVA